MWLSYYAGLPQMSFALAAACYYTAPAWMALAARLLGEPVGPRDDLKRPKGDVGEIADGGRHHIEAGLRPGGRPAFAEKGEAGLGGRVAHEGLYQLSEERGQSLPQPEVGQCPPPKSSEAVDMAGAGERP